MAESLTSPRRLAAHARRLEALDLRKQGYSYEEIASDLGYSDRAHAYNDVKRALTGQIAEEAKEVVSFELNRLDAMLLGLWKAAAGGDTQAIDRVLKIMDRRAKYLGLDYAPSEERNVAAFDEFMRGLTGTAAIPSAPVGDAGVDDEGPTIP